MKEDYKPVDGAEYISLKDAKRLKLPFYETVAAGFPSPASDYQHESLDMNDKFVHHPEASYFVRVRGESMIGLGILDGDICLADRQEEVSDGNIVVGSQQYTKPGGKGRADVFKDSIKHDFRSPCYTTRWSDIPEAT